MLFFNPRAPDVSYNNRIATLCRLHIKYASELSLWRPTLPKARFKYTEILVLVLRVPEFAQIADLVGV